MRQSPQSSHCSSGLHARAAQGAHLCRIDIHFQEDEGWVLGGELVEVRANHPAGPTPGQVHSNLHGTLAKACSKGRLGKKNVISKGRILNGQCARQCLTMWL